MFFICRKEKNASHSVQLCFLFKDQQKEPFVFTDRKIKKGALSPTPEEKRDPPGYTVFCTYVKRNSNPNASAFCVSIEKKAPNLWHSFSFVLCSENDIEPRLCNSLT